MEQAENVGARVDNGEVGVVGGQNPVGAVGGNWEKRQSIYPPFGSVYSEYGENDTYSRRS